ncbi:uncharacterized protein METZ01_LOCUS201086, partial [marine metagenome]
HADMNGVVVFPVDLTDYVIDESAKVTKRESDQFNWVKSEDFSLEKMIQRG